MPRLAIWLLALAACGDNHRRPVDAASGEGDGETGQPPAVTCPVHGRNVSSRRVAYGCGVAGAPAAPGCIAGTAATLVTSPPDDPRLFVVELQGRIRVIAGGALRGEPFLDISRNSGGPVNADGLGELGLLGLAFHPGYATNRQLFVFYTMDNPDRADAMNPYLDVLVRYTASAADPDRADPASATPVLAILDPFSNHNGGMIEFGNDGYLYISTGDGGGAAGLPADPYNHAQDPHELLGKILRIDVDHRLPGKEYGIPLDNPYASGTFGAGEVWVLGLRNPWRWSFDRATGDMWIGDVGASTVEEIDMLPAGHQAGVNLGWPTWEGDTCYAPPCDRAGKVFPIDNRNHATGFWAITGGQVYRGSCYPDLVGTYLYTDTGYAYIQGATRRPDGSFEIAQLSKDYNYGPASLHAGPRGELYETDIYGNVWQLIVVP
jgi:glucose/arabinose dehydrogenase